LQDSLPQQNAANQPWTPHCLSMARMIPSNSASHGWHVDRTVTGLADSLPGRDCPWDMRQYHRNQSAYGKNISRCPRWFGSNEAQERANLRCYVWLHQGIINSQQKATHSWRSAQW
jgi:hypothetical protein